MATLFSHFLKNPFVASVASTSYVAAEKICEYIDFSAVDVIVEYGPGTGAITKKLLKYAHIHTKIFVIEKVASLVKELEQIKDDRLVIIHASAVNVNDEMHKRGIKKVDVVISGIPFSMISTKDKESIFAHTKNLLGSNGKFIVYQFVAKLEYDLRRYFHNVVKSRIWKNIPPLILFIATNKR